MGNVTPVLPSTRSGMVAVLGTAIAERAALGDCRPCNAVLPTMPPATATLLMINLRRVVLRVIFYSYPLTAIEISETVLIENSLYILPIFLKVPTSSFHSSLKSVIRGRLFNFRVQSILISLFFLLGFSSSAISQSSNPEPQSSVLICEHQLNSKLNGIVNRSQFKRFRWGILLKTLSKGEAIYSRDAEHYFIPASTVKLMTTAAALSQLTPNYRILTSIYGDQQGNLYIVGRGDPSLTATQLEDLAQQLQNKGINQVNQLIADQGYFPGFVVHPSWEWEDIQAGHGAPVNSLILHQNSIDLILSPQAVNQPLKVTWVRPQQAQKWQIKNNTITVGETEREFVEIGRDLTQPILYISGQLRAGSEPEPVYAAVVEPTDNFLQEFRQILESKGIRVLKTAIVSNSQHSPEELAIVESPPIAELIKTVNLESNNIFAEALLRTLGVQKPSLDAVETGLTAIQDILKKLGVEPESYRLVDGSGLSRQNLISPEALTQTLIGMANSQLFEIYKKSLPIAAETGTLKGRFRGTSAAGIVYAKTGTLTGVSGLAGYLYPPNYQPLVFSILVNHSNQSASELRQAIDEIVILLSQLKSC
jgi:D-alanyl-D-alanine carboxypeptidase/D-alanyl-D-alanine-endopeptidase (penicillin-binding protein 4)